MNQNWISIRLRSISETEPKGIIYNIPIYNSDEDIKELLKDRSIITDTTFFSKGDDGMISLSLQ